MNVEFWQELGLVIAALILGTAGRTVLPYVTTGLQAVIEAESWSAWPKWNPKYPASLALALIAYTLALFVPGTAEYLMGLDFLIIVGLSYGGTDITRRVATLAIPRWR